MSGERGKKIAVELGNNKKYFCKTLVQNFNSFFGSTKLGFFYCLDGGWKPVLCIKCHDLIFLIFNYGQIQEI